VIQVADMHRRLRIGARLFERELEETRIGFLDAPVV